MVKNLLEGLRIQISVLGISLLAKLLDD